MKRYISIFLLVLTFCPIIFGQLSGPLSGTIESGTYTINGEITVEAGDSLVIEPGTVFNFQGHYKFIISGWLIAEGTESDSIMFTGADTSEGWHGIRFIDAPDSSRLIYCVIEDGRAVGDSLSTDNYGGALYCISSAPVISSCTIKENYAEQNGGGIACVNSNPTINDCLFFGNACWSGGGIACTNSSPVILNCTFASNTTMHGGGVSCSDDSNPIINGCAIINNTGNFNGGGINLRESSPIITDCTINGNSADDFGGGGGICCDLYSSPLIENCVINNNSAYWGGGINVIFSSNPQIVNCSIFSNSAENIGGGMRFNNTSDALIVNCTISANTAVSSGGGICINADVFFLNNIIWSNSAQQGNQIFINDTVSSLSCTYSDIQGGWEGEGNIDADPLFFSTTGDSAYYLTANSPCIDAGDPSSPLDPDSTRADMGAYYFDQGVSIADNSCSIKPLVFSLNPPYPNPFNQKTTIYYSLLVFSQVNLTVYDIAGREVTKLVDGFKSAGTHQVILNTEGLANGVYLVRLEANGLNDVKKIILVK